MSMLQMIRKLFSYLKSLKIIISVKDVKRPHIIDDAPKIIDKTKANLFVPYFSIINHESSIKITAVTIHTVVISNSFNISPIASIVLWYCNRATQLSNQQSQQVPVSLLLIPIIFWFQKPTVFVLLACISFKLFVIKYYQHIHYFV